MKILMLITGLLLSAFHIESDPCQTPYTDNITLSSTYKMGIGVEVDWVLSERFESASKGKLTGFHVYRSNQPKEGFKLLTAELLSPEVRAFIDSAYAEDAPNFYRVEAYDIKGNTIISAPAPPIILKHKQVAQAQLNNAEHGNAIFKKTTLQNDDPNTPPRSTFKSVKTSLNKVDITFANAKADDLSRVELSRKSLDGRRWQVIHSIKGDVNKEDIVRYKDQKIEPGRQYIYRLQTIDNNGLKSPYVFSNIVKTTNRIEVENIQNISATRANGHIQISWSYKPSNEVYFIVYRTFNDGTLRQVGRSESNNFTDTNPPKGKVSYAVKPMRTDGNKGRLSEQITVK